MEDIPSASSFSAVHFVGIGGAGMSGIALVLHQRGCRVTGSDVKVSRYVRDLEDAGISVHVGHAAETIDQEKPEVVVISSAIPDENVEVVRARELGIPVWPRAKMLSALSLDATTIAVAGTHGKTTTSSMVATMLDHADVPYVILNGFTRDFPNARAVIREDSRECFSRLHRAAVWRLPFCRPRTDAGIRHNKSACRGPSVLSRIPD